MLVQEYMSSFCSLIAHKHMQLLKIESEASNDYVSTKVFADYISLYTDKLEKFGGMNVCTYHL